ncbi:MAG: hypothetical protein ACMUHY_04775 [Thermoplasmatota archaeon]
MGALSAMNDSFRFFQKRFSDLVIPAAEGYLIMMCVSLVLTPLIIAMMFPALILAVSTDTSAIVFMVVMILLIYIVSIGASAFGIGIMYGGMVKAIDDTRNHRKVKFGDMFRYGWKNKWEFFGIQLLNYFLYLLLTMGIVGFAVVIGILVIFYDEILGIITLIMMMFGTSLLLYTFIPLQYLPFVIRHKKGTRGIVNVAEAWKEFFSDFFGYGGIGFLYMLLIILLMFIPGINMIVSLAMHPAFISTLLIYYDEKYKIPVMPEPPSFPLYAPYPPYVPSYHPPGYPPPPYASPVDRPDR